MTNPETKTLTIYSPQDLPLLMKDEYPLAADASGIYHVVYPNKNACDINGWKSACGGVVGGAAPGGIRAAAPIMRTGDLAVLMQFELCKACSVSPDSALRPQNAGKIMD